MFNRESILKINNQENNQKKYHLPITNVKNPRHFIQQYNKFFWKTRFAEMHKCPVPVVIVVCTKFLDEREK